MYTCLWLDFHYNLSLEKQLTSQLSSFMYNWISPFQCMFLGSARDLQRVYQQNLGLLPTGYLLSRIPTFMSNTSGCSESYPLFHHMDQKLHIKVIHLCCLLPACAHMLSCSVVSDSLGPHGLSLPGTSVHGIFHARILEWVAEDFLRICIKKNLSILQALTPLQNLLTKSNLRSDSPPHNTLKGRLQGVCTPGGGNITQGHLRFLPATNCYTKSEINLLNFII